MRKEKKPFNSMKEAIRHLREEGFTHEFLISREGIKDPLTQQHYPLHCLRIYELYHLDQDSRFPNLEVIYALEADDGTRGWLSSGSHHHLEEVLAHLSARELKPAR